MAGRADVEAGGAFVKLFLKNDMTKQLATTLRAASKQLKSFGQSATALGTTFLKTGAVMSAPFIASIKAAFNARHGGVSGLSRLAHDLLLRPYLATQESEELSASFADRRSPDHETFGK